jgi:hypothetical protein
MPTTGAFPTEPVPHAESGTSKFALLPLDIAVFPKLLLLIV